MSLSSTIAPTDEDAAIPCPIPEPKPAKPIATPAPIAAKADTIDITTKKNYNKKNNNF